MVLDDLNGIANVQFGQVDTLSWGTAAEWDASPDAQGVVTRDYGDRISDEIWQGYDTDLDPLLNNVLAYYPLDGSTGANTEGTDATLVDGPTTGATGLLGSTSFHFDFDAEQEVGAYLNMNGVLGGPYTEFTFACWFKTSAPAASSQGDLFGASSDGGFDNWVQVSDDPGMRFGLRNDSGSRTFIDTPQNVLSSDTWHFIVATWDGSTMYLYVDATEEASGSFSGNVTMGSFTQLLINHGGQGDRWLNGTLDEVIFLDAALSSSQVQALYDVATTGHLETETKSLSSPGQPNLQNLDYALNGQSIDLKVIGSPGTASEEVLTEALDGGTSYSLGWSNSHTDFRLRPELSTSDVTVTPVFRAGELQ